MEIVYLLIKIFKFIFYFSLKNVIFKQVRTNGFNTLTTFTRSLYNLKATDKNSRKKKQQQTIM